MATTNCTLGNRFAKSKFLAKTYSLHSKTHSLPVSESDCAYFLISHVLDNNFAELMETLRLHLNDVLRLPFASQQRSRLVRNYWEVELLVKEIRLLLNPDVLAQLRLKMLEQHVFEGDEP